MNMNIEMVDGGTVATLIISGEKNTIINYYNGLFNFQGTRSEIFDESGKETELWMGPNCFQITVIKAQLINAFYQIAYAKLREMAYQLNRIPKRKEFAAKASW